MAVNLSPYGGVGAQFLDNAGNVLTGGKIETYAAGTTVPQATYTSSVGVTFHPNPIILDASGRVPSGGEIWLTDGLLYKFVLRDSNNVLIATYDNIAGINSNFVNFVNEQEIQTATAGQTVFNLTTTNYTPGTNSLSVFVDGVNQYGPGAQYAYLETNSTTVTFVNGLHVGALVKFTTSQLSSSGATAASQVSFTGFKGQTGTVQDLADDDGSDWIGFEPAGANAVARSAQDKMRDFVTPKDFGITGDVLIPTNFSSLQAAIDALGPNQPAPVVLRVESGHVVDQGVLVENNDYSAFSIVSSDSPGLIGAGVTGNFIEAQNASAPTLSALFDMQGNGSRGYFLDNNSRGAVNSSCGVDNAGLHGCSVSRGSILSAQGSLWRNAGQISGQLGSGVFVTSASIADVSLSEANGARQDGITSRRASSVNAFGSTANNCGNNGFSCTRAFLNIESATLNSSGQNGLLAVTGSIVSASGITALNNGLRDISVLTGAIIVANNCTTTAGANTVDNTNVPAFNYRTSDGVIHNANASPATILAPVQVSSFSLTNDTAVAIPILPSSLTTVTGFLDIVSTAATSPNGTAAFRVGTFPFVQAAGIDVTLIDFTTGVLTGTTGVVGRFTISAATDGSIYLENRTGVTRTSKWWVRR
jgi:hypothetical protein